MKRTCRCFLLPSRNLTIVSPFVPEEVCFRLRLLSCEKNAEITPLYPFRFPSGKQFYGSVRTDGFLLRGILPYRNSFNPLLRGTIGRPPPDAAGIEAQGSQIEVRIQLDSFCKVFCSLYYGFMAFMAFLLLFDMLLNDRSFSLVRFAPLLCAAFLYGLISFGFQTASKFVLRRLYSAVGVFHGLADR